MSRAFTYKKYCIDTESFKKMEKEKIKKVMPNFELYQENRNLNPIYTPKNICFCQIRDEKSV
jgi:hypothetical protein